MNGIKMSATSYQLSTHNHQLLSWHGWQFALPQDWNPVKIEGDWHKGSLVIADFHATRLAVRWQAASGRKFDAPRWTQQAIAAEVGQLMLAQSTPFVPGKGFSVGRLFVEPQPPGRDVWVGQSTVTNRLIEIVYQTKIVSRLLRDTILPSISDQPTGGPTHWAIFDLSCTAPAGWTLKSQRLNAGDLTLSFGMKNDVIIVRQLAPATLALSRQPLEKWLDAQQQIWKKMYRASGEIQEFEPIDPVLTPATNTIIARTIRRRRRFFMLRWVAKQRVTLATHDRERGRIVLIDADRAERAEQMLASVGKAGNQL